MRALGLVCLFVTISVFTTACKGCKGDPCDDVVCAGDESCVEGECVANSVPCDPECSDQEVCQAGVCVELAGACTELAQECDPSLPTQEPFVCLDPDGFGPRPGECVERCAEDGSCAPGALCFYLAAFDDEPCGDNTDCPQNKECVQGACRGSVCRPSECSGFLAGNDTCADFYANTEGFEAGAQCYEIGNEASFCYPAGTMGDGESCIGIVDAILGQNFPATCVAGFACVDDACRAACEDDANCSGDDTCLLEEQDFVDDGVGVCGRGCTPFQSGQCSSSETCIPVSADEGVCIPAGSRQAFEDCTPGAGECEDGTLCIPFQAGPPAVARCQPICNVTVGPPNDDGSVGELAQSQRDETCPQGAEPVAWVRLVNAAEIGAPIDVYLDGGATPTFSAVALDGTTDAWAEIPPGTHQLKFLPAGAPQTDVPLDEISVSFGAEEAVQVALLPVFGATDEVRAETYDGARDVAVPAAGNAMVRVLHAMVDTPAAVDVVLVPPGDDLSVPANQTDVASNVAIAVQTPFSEVSAGMFDLLLFPAGDPRADRTSAVFESPVTIGDGDVTTLVLRGTLDPDDAFGAVVATIPVVEAPAIGSSGPTFTCVDIGNGVYGFCQENCGDSAAGFGSDFCSGQNAGCHPTFLDASFAWANLCAPLGSKSVGDACDPLREYSECAEGLYCLEYGNTSPGFDPANRGRCTSYCDTADDANADLACASDQACQQFASSADYTIGRCGYDCTPDEEYTDTDCPAGLQSCKPTAALTEDPADPDRPPNPVVQDSFCSASGDLAAEASCFGNDCTPGTECMFPRSSQTTFTSTLASQYFGAPGLTPVCEPQCDPFDGDSSSTTCASGETCLFNFPWSAEVGHCAPIMEERTPLDGCEFPGQSCGEDSICVINGGQAVCFQFCQYRGPDAMGNLVRETCGASLVCAPLVNDIGVCL